MDVTDIRVWYESIFIIINNWRLYDLKKLRKLGTGPGPVRPVSVYRCTISRVLSILQNTYLSMLLNVSDVINVYLVNMI